MKTLGHISDFYHFDFVSFFEGKKGEVIKIEPSFQYNRDPADPKKTIKTDIITGTKVTVCIIEDNTKYNLTAKDNERGWRNNKYNELTFKIDIIDYKGICIGDIVGKGGYIPVVRSCTPYGQNGFLNNLSINLEGFRKDKKEI